MSNELPTPNPEDLALLLQRLMRAGWVHASAVSETHNKGGVILTELGEQRIAQLDAMLKELKGRPTARELIAFLCLLPVLSGRLRTGGGAATGDAEPPPFGR